MTNTELLDNLEKDLSAVSAPKQAHIQIENILRAYRKMIDQEEIAKQPQTKKTEQ
jgi:hypothetical protein